MNVNELDQFDSCASFRLLSLPKSREFICEFGWELFDRAHEFASTLARIDGDNQRDLMNLISLIAGTHFFPPI